MDFDTQPPKANDMNIFFVWLILSERLKAIVDQTDDNRL